LQVGGLCAKEEVPDPVHLARLLRLGAERPKNRSEAEKSYRIASLHSIPLAASRRRTQPISTYTTPH
jgi:hypothetical protein